MHIMSWLYCRHSVIQHSECTPICPVLPVESCGIISGRYAYTNNLLALEAMGAESTSHLPPLRGAEVSGFLPATEWEPFLSSHPDQRFAEFIRRGIQFGFRIGFNRNQQLKLCKSNLQSTRQNEQQVDKYISEEAASGKLQTHTNVSTPFHWSPIGIIPKPHQPGKYRLIIDLSAPRGFSVNDGIPPELCSLQYTTVGEAASLVAKLGRGALQAMLDLSQTYRRVPVHEHDQPLLGLTWHSSRYIDKALPFGLR